MNPIPEGAEIERCPLLFLSTAPDELADHVVGVRSSMRFPVALPLGFGALYNHSVTPNADWSVHRLQAAMIVTAATEITRGDEILIRYGGDFFAPRGISAIV
jgi:hypothetical protein